MDILSAYILSFCIGLITAKYYNYFPDDFTELFGDWYQLLVALLIIPLVILVVDFFLTKAAKKLLGIKSIKVSYVISSFLTWLVVRQLCLMITET